MNAFDATRTAALDAALKGIESALSPRGIVDAAARARMTIMEIEAKSSLDGNPISPAVSASIQRLDVAVSASAPRAKRLAESIANIAEGARRAAGAYGGGIA